ncbi:GNAT family N-acetyltransferase [Streptomyces albipurpureus]|uniref:GNAT family N-acetyltransferase n=1 Tax=Streptomyces albipurpureus TaxID=2897419 RepID=A0ABT0UZS8_9ACTN|nr:GNAT family N-acetyltransferase [Streptomyces sp. CWNU-1]MCM2393974.1 GNAT family N-acetyltransferase [Streptomyces sp. CWNU-1]
MPVPTPAPRLTIRPYEERDERGVLDLVNADRLLGQPVTTGQMLRDHIGHHPRMVGDSVAPVAVPEADVVVDQATGEIVGAAAYAARDEASGYVRWLHCREGRVVADALIAHLLRRFGPDRRVDAFESPTPLGYFLEGFPARHRPTTLAAMESAGFTASDEWGYRHARLPLPGLARVEYTLSEPHHPDLREMVVSEDGERVASATIGLPQYDGIGILWSITVEPPARGRGLGSALLGSAMTLLTELGAREVILFADDAPPPPPGGDDRVPLEDDHTVVTRMYDRAGFREVDRLLHFIRCP